MPPVAALSDAPWRLDCRGRMLDARPQGLGGPAHVVGVLNVTPDSFSDGGRYTSVQAAVDRAAEMEREGATLVDVGGESTRPAGVAYGAGAAVVSIDEETDRVVPVIEAIVRALPHLLVSVDTSKGPVARAALRAGAHLVNDVYGLRDGTGTAQAAADYSAPLIVMHSAGRPGAMPHEAPTPAPTASPRDIVETVLDGLAASVAAAEACGVRSIVVDAGFGFGKTPAENLCLIGETARLVHDLGRPVMVGVSRKHTVGVVLGNAHAPAPVGARLIGSLALAAQAVLGGASLVRTHDVRPTAELLRTLAAVAAARRPDAP
ncbi:MAG TPA: dihydropteroate synthase [Rubricoccaceae bacterium]|jgi:dihydropteroate synthase